MYKCDDDITSFKYVQQKKIKIKNKINNKKLTKTEEEKKKKRK